MITTSGFRDVLELGRRDRPSMYGLTGEQDPLIPRDYRFEVSERISAAGDVLQPLDLDEVRRLGEAFAKADVEAVVVAFLHAYANPAHELAAAECLRELDAEFETVLSHEVCNEYFEFERTSTAAVQGYLQPMVANYARRLKQRLEEAARQWLRAGERAQASSSNQEAVSHLQRGLALLPSLRESGERVVDEDSVGDGDMEGRRRNLA